MLSLRSLFAYGVLGLPLAMAALPVYVLAPGFYGDTLGMSLGVLGATLLASRLIDTVQDPLFGHWSDRLPNGRVVFTCAGVPILAAGFVMLFNPPAFDAGALVAWLMASLILAYSGYSMCSISYQAWGAEIPHDATERTRVTGVREGFALIGVVIAAVLPQLLMTRLDTSLAMAWFTGVFVAVLVIAASITLFAAPRPPGRRQPPASPWKNWRDALTNRDFVHLCAIFLLNGMAAAIPATLVVFYVEYVLEAASVTGLFLGLYFLAGIGGMPLWIWLARRWDKRRSWLLAMALAIIAFAWAALLGSGDIIPFAVICLATGLALGADLALPPAMLADVLADRAHAFDATGSHFGLWNLLAKLSLALAAGLALPLLQWLGFSPGNAATGIGALAAVYAVLPCLLKLCAAAGLICWRRQPVVGTSTAS